MTKLATQLKQALLNNKLTGTNGKVSVRSVHVMRQGERVLSHVQALVRGLSDSEMQRVTQLVPGASFIPSSGLTLVVLSATAPASASLPVEPQTLSPLA